MADHHDNIPAAFAARLGRLRAFHKHCFLTRAKDWVDEAKHMLDHCNPVERERAIVGYMRPDVPLLERASVSIPALATVTRLEALDYLAKHTAEIAERHAKQLVEAIEALVPAEQQERVLSDPRLLLTRCGWGLSCPEKPHHLLPSLVVDYMPLRSPEEAFSEPSLLPDHTRVEAIRWAAERLGTPAPVLERVVKRMDATEADGPLGLHWHGVLPAFLALQSLERQPKHLVVKHQDTNTSKAVH